MRLVREIFKEASHVHISELELKGSELIIYIKPNNPIESMGLVYKLLIYHIISTKCRQIYQSHGSVMRVDYYSQVTRI